MGQFRSFFFRIEVTFQNIAHFVLSFLTTHALKSGNETKFWLALAKDVAPENKDTLDTLLTEVDELTKILGSSMATLKGKKNL